MADKDPFVLMEKDFVESGARRLRYVNESQHVGSLEEKRFLV
jgi:hypothetical protein